MSKRTDIHRPSVIDPEQYQYVAEEMIRIEGLGDCAVIMAERKIFDAHRQRTGADWSGHAHGGNCMVCGSVNAMYTSIFYHELSNTYVRVGSDCAQKLSFGVDMHRVSAFRRGVANAREAQAGKKKAQALLADHGLTRAWAIHTTPLPEYGAFGEPDDDNNPRAHWQYEETTIDDMVGKLVKYGSLSDKQFAFLSKLLQRIDSRAERMAARQAESDAASPAPTGRVEFTGEVLSVKAQESDFGDVLKMLIKSTDGGWKVWCTMPSALVALQASGQREATSLRGAIVTLRATLKPASNDPKFAYGSRPTFVRIEEVMQAQV